MLRLSCFRRCHWVVPESKRRAPPSGRLECQDPDIHPPCAYNFLRSPPSPNFLPNFPSRFDRRRGQIFTKHGGQIVRTWGDLNSCEMVKFGRTFGRSFGEPFGPLFGTSGTPEKGGHRNWSTNRSSPTKRRSQDSRKLSVFAKRVVFQVVGLQPVSFFQRSLEVVGLGPKAQPPQRTRHIDRKLSVFTQRVVFQTVLASSLLFQRYIEVVGLWSPNSA